MKFYVKCRCVFVGEIKAKIIECSEKITSGIYSHREKKNARNSPAWLFFHEIVDESDNTIENFFFCIKCQAVEHCTRLHGSTTQLLRHSCVLATSIDNIHVNPNDIQKIARAAAKFVCIDLRPFNAVECSGLRELVLAGVELGKKYPSLKTEDFLQILPSRKTVKTIIADEANRAKEAIKILFRHAIEQNGFGCTMDLWTDNYKSNSYIAMTANMYLIRDTGIDQKRIVFHMGHFDEIVKSKPLIKARVIEVFRSFGVSTEEIKENVTFTTDR